MARQAPGGADAGEHIVPCGGVVLLVALWGVTLPRPSSSLFVLNGRRGRVFPRFGVCRKSFANAGNPLLQTKHLAGGVLVCRKVKLSAHQEPSIGAGLARSTLRRC